MKKLTAIVLSLALLACIGLAAAEEADLNAMFQEARQASMNGDAAKANELFEQHQKQLQGYIDNHQINMLERICVKSASLSEFKQIGDKDVLTVVLNSKMIDYISVFQTGK